MCCVDDEKSDVGLSSVKELASLDLEGDLTSTQKRELFSRIKSNALILLRNMTNINPLLAINYGQPSPLSHSHLTSLIFIQTSFFPVSSNVFVCMCRVLGKYYLEKVLGELSAYEATEVAKTGGNPSSRRYCTVYDDVYLKLEAATALIGNAHAPHL